MYSFRWGKTGPVDRDFASENAQQLESEEIGNTDQLSGLVIPYQSQRVRQEHPGIARHRRKRTQHLRVSRVAVYVVHGSRGRVDLVQPRGRFPLAHSRRSVEVVHCSRLECFYCRRGPRPRWSAGTGARRRSRRKEVRQRRCGKSYRLLLEAACGDHSARTKENAIPSNVDHYKRRVCLYSSTTLTTRTYIPLYIMFLFLSATTFLHVSYRKWTDSVLAPQPNVGGGRPNIV